MNDSIRSVHGHPRAERGFTLIEVLIAIVVLVFGLARDHEPVPLVRQLEHGGEPRRRGFRHRVPGLENLKAQAVNSGQL